MKSWGFPKGVQIALAALLFLLCCRTNRASPNGSTQEPRALRSYGDVMSTVGRRFELAGRAGAVGRFAFANYEVEEIQELFEGDLPVAEPPKKGQVEVLRGMRKAFAETFPKDLKVAAMAGDRAAFAGAYARAAEACNACHKASGHEFIEVPPTPGRSVPNLEPFPTVK